MLTEKPTIYKVLTVQGTTMHLESRPVKESPMLPEPCAATSLLPLQTRSGAAIHTSLCAKEHQGQRAVKISQPKKMIKDETSKSRNVAITQQKCIDGQNSLFGKQKPGHEGMMSNNPNNKTDQGCHSGTNSNIPKLLSEGPWVIDFTAFNSICPRSKNIEFDFICHGPPCTCSKSDPFGPWCVEENN